MATVHPLDTTTDTDEGVLGLAARLVRLEVELARAEVQAMLVGAVVALAVGLAGVLTLAAGFVVLLAALLAPLFGATWEHLVVAGGLAVLAAVAAMAFSAWRLRRLGRPRLTLASLDETLQWLEAQLRFRLRSS
jgi:hypothetical protein